MEEHRAALVWLYIGLHCFGCVGVTAILVTVCVSSKVRRYSTWISFAISWVIFPISFLLLFLGGQQTKPVPSHGLCLAQAGLVYASPVLCACTTLALVVQLWSHAVTLFANRRVNIPVIALVVSPYLVFLLILLEALVVGSIDPSKVNRERGMYCGITSFIPGKVTAIISIIALVAALAFEGLTLHVLICHWRSLQGRPAINTGKLLPPLVFRVFLFSVAELFAITVSGILLSSAESVQDPANISLATMPLVFILLFGTQEDILRVWMFRKIPTPYEPVNSLNSSPESPKHCAALDFVPHFYMDHCSSNR